MSEPTTPPPFVEVNSIGIPSTSPNAHEAIMPSTPPLVIRPSNPAKFKRKFTSVLASLYDDEPIPNPKAKAKAMIEKKAELASPPWKNPALELTRGDEQKEVLGDDTKELTPPAEKIAIPQLSEEVGEGVLPATVESAFSQVTEPASNDLDDAPATAPTDSTLSAEKNESILNVEVIGSPTSVGAIEDLQTKNVPVASKANDKLRHEWTGTSNSLSATEISIGIQKDASVPRILLDFIN